MTKTPKNPNTDNPNLTLASSNDKPATPIKAKVFKPKVTLPEATFSPELLSKILNELTENKKQLAELMAAPKAKVDKPATAKVDLSARNDADCIRIFKRAGFKEPLTPRVNILTFRKWVENGYRPVEKSKALKVNNLRLWHVSQVRPLTKDEIKAAKTQLAAAKLRREGRPELELT